MPIHAIIMILQNIQIGITLFLYQISTQFCTYGGVFVWWGFRGRWFLICYLNFQGSQGSCQGNQMWAKISKNCTDFSCVQKRGLFTRIVRFSGSENLNMLSEILREPRELLWQPNLDKSQPKMHKIPCLDRIVHGRNVVNGSSDGVGKCYLKF